METKTVVVTINCAPHTEKLLFLAQKRDFSAIYKGCIIL